MISILCPTRGRPELFRRMVESIRDTAVAPDSFEVLAYVDDDDPKLADYRLVKPSVRYMYVDKPVTVGRAWNVLAEHSKGDYLLMGNDDHVYITPGWDKLLIDTLSERAPSDGIFVAWVDDGIGGGANRCAFPIVSRKWYETLGYFTPQCFNFFFHDTWVWDIGRRLYRTIYIPEILIEHRHFTAGKSEYDETYQRHRTGRQNIDKDTFKKTAHQRQEDAKKLKQVMVLEYVHIR